MLKKIQKESQAISSEIPDNVEIWLFGSSIHTSHFNDIDILFIASNDVIDKIKLYDMVQIFCQLLSQKLGHVIDFTILTQSEEKTINFIKNTQALPIPKT